MSTQHIGPSTQTQSIFSQRCSVLCEIARTDGYDGYEEWLKRAWSVDAHALFHTQTSRTPRVLLSELGANGNIFSRECERSHTYPDLDRTCNHAMLSPSLTQSDAYCSRVAATGAADASRLASWLPLALVPPDE